MEPLRSLILAVTLLVGIVIGVGVTGRLEPVFDSMLALFAGPVELDKPSLVPVDFDPFDPCLWGATSPHDLCI